MDEEERIKQFCRAYASVPAIGSMFAHQARHELEKGCELFPETVKARVRKLYEHAGEKQKERKLLPTDATEVTPRAA